jgi:hypothetical protein
MAPAVFLQRPLAIYSDTFFDLTRTVLVERNFVRTM